MLTKQKKQKIIQKYKTHANDTGSPEVQIAILSEEIKELAKHLKSHKHDYSSRRGLLKKIGERKRLLRYLSSESEERFLKIVDLLNLKISKTMQKKREEDKAQELLMEAGLEADKQKKESLEDENKE